MQKNDELILKIEDMGVDGAGIGKSDGMTFFVKDAVIGDVVRKTMPESDTRHTVCNTDNSVPHDPPMPPTVPSAWHSHTSFLT